MLAVWDTQWWHDIRQTVDQDRVSDFVDTLSEDPEAPKPSDPLRRPPAKRKAEVAEVHRDRELAAVLSKTEIMVLNFYQGSRLSQRRGQLQLCCSRPRQEQ